MAIRSHKVNNGAASNGHNGHTNGHNGSAKTPRTTAKPAAKAKPVKTTGAGRKPMDESGENMKRLPVFLSQGDKKTIENRHGKGKASGWIRDLVKKALKPMPVYGPVCCGDGIEAFAQEETKTVLFIEDLLPTTQADKYLFPAQGDSMNNPRDPRSDIQDNDVLVCVAREDAENGQPVHFQMDDGFGGRICGVRYWKCENDIVTLRASNDAVHPTTGERMYPDLVVARHEVEVKGVWLRIKFSGVRL